MLKSILNSFKCSLIRSHICDYNGSNKQLYSITIFHKNCFKVYINDVLMPKQISFIASTYKGTNTIKIKLVGVFNNQTSFLEVRTKSIDVFFPLFKKRNVINSVNAINKLSYKAFNFSSLIKHKEIRIRKTLKRVNTIELSKNVKLETTITNQHYNLTNIYNNYE